MLDNKDQVFNSVQLLEDYFETRVSVLGQQDRNVRCMAALLLRLVNHFEYML